MKKSRFSEEQVTYALRLAESGTPMVEVPPDGDQRSDVSHLEEEVRELWRDGLRRLRQLEEENARLKRLAADLTLDKQILSEAIRKK